jgi:hypothetical protein
MDRERDLKNHAEQALVVATLSTATLVAVFIFLLVK